jgi:hypothetical protein
MTISSQRKSAIIEELVDRMHARIPARADAINQDGHLPGTLMMPGKQRLDFFWAMTPDFSDVPLLLDPDWELRIREGLDRAPVNPYWLNHLSIPGMLKQYSQDFKALILRYAEDGNEVRQDSREPAPVPASGGVSGYV